MSETYVQLVVREFSRLQSLAERAMAQLSDEQFFAAPAPGDNSVAVIVKHVSGNLVSRWTDFLCRDGEKPGRDREAEFRITASDTRERHERLVLLQVKRVPRRSVGSLGPADQFESLQKSDHLFVAAQKRSVTPPCRDNLSAAASISEHTPCK